MMMIAPKRSRFILLILIAIFIQLMTTGYNHVPVTGLVDTINDSLYDPIQADPSIKNYTIDPSRAEKTQIFNEFVNSVMDGEAGIIRGIFVEDEFGLYVTQQPANNPAFVSTEENIVTEFSMPKKYGTLGMLAHNFAAGENFFSLELNDIVQVVYGDGEIEQYEIVEILQYQALSPDSPRSNFLDLETGKKLTATQLFKRVYTGSHHLTLQTCIEQGSEDSWGRLFLIAEPI